MISNHWQLHWSWALAILQHHPFLLLSPFFHLFFASTGFWQVYLPFGPWTTISEDFFCWLLWCDYGSCWWCGTNIFGVAELFPSIFRAFCRAHQGDYFDPLITPIRPLVPSLSSCPFSLIFGLVPDAFCHRSTRFWAQTKALDNPFPSPLLAYQRVRSFLIYSLFRHYHPFCHPSHVPFSVLCTPLGLVTLSPVFWYLWWHLYLPIKPIVPGATWTSLLYLPQFYRYTFVIVLSSIYKNMFNILIIHVRFRSRTCVTLNRTHWPWTYGSVQGSENSVDRTFGSGHGSQNFGVTRTDPNRGITIRDQLYLR